MWHLLHTVISHGGLLALVGGGAPALIAWADKRDRIKARLSQLPKEGHR